MHTIYIIKNKKKKCIVEIFHQSYIQRPPKKKILQRHVYKRHSFTGGPHYSCWVHLCRHLSSPSLRPPPMSRAAGRPFSRPLSEPQSWKIGGGGAAAEGNRRRAGRCFWSGGRAFGATTPSRWGDAAEEVDPAAAGRYMEDGRGGPEVKRQGRPKVRSIRSLGFDLVIY